MYDFQNIMVTLGIEAEEVINAYSVCPEIIDETRKLAAKIGFEYDTESLTFDINGNYPDDTFADMVKHRVMDRLWQGEVQDDNLTAHIVTSCYDITFGLLENTDLFKTLDAKFEGGMPLAFQVGNKIHKLDDIDSLDTSCAETIVSALADAVVDKLHEAINKTVKGDYKKEWIEDDLANSAYDKRDIFKCLQSGEAGTSIIQTATARVATALIEQHKRSPAAERG